MVSFKHRYTDGQAYVALSRVRNLQGLYILDFEPKKIRANKDVKDEMKHLSENKSLEDSYVFFKKSNCPSLCSVISSLNTRSVVLHSQDIAKDPVFLLSDVVVFTETWLSGRIMPDSVISSDFTVCCSDKPQTDHHRHSGGVAVVLNKSLPYKLLQTYSDTYLQIVAVTVSIFKETSYNLIAIYNSPHQHNKIQHTVARVISILDMISDSNHYPVIVVGDLNENLLDSKVATKFRNALEERGFHQYIMDPTHRSGSCIDHFYINDDAHIDVQHNSCYFSDHDWISCKLQLQ